MNEVLAVMPEAMGQHVRSTLSGEVSAMSENRRYDYDWRGGSLCEQEQMNIFGRLFPFFLL